MPLRRVCVFCDPDPNAGPEHRELAASVGWLLADNGVTLVYAGETGGAIDALAEAMIRAGAGAIAVVTASDALNSEIPAGRTERKVVASIDERNAALAELSDGFLALPGGIGSLEELFAIWTWGGGHEKPCGLLNRADYYTRLLHVPDDALLDRYVRERQRGMLIVDRDPAALLRALADFRPPRPAASSPTTIPEERAVLSLLLSLSLIQAPADAYRALFVRAAPGRLMELVELVKARRDSAPAASRPVVLRHSQGDQWDLVLLQPVGSLSKYFATEHTAPDPLWNRLVAWQEELFTSGPPAAEFRAAADRAGFFHLEIFQALAGERDSLRAEREMENRFLKAIGRQANLVFTRTAGASWDLFTVGFYRDLQHYAEPSGRTPEQEEAAARAAGFVSRESIGPYLRRFINGHHDTIGSVVR